MRKKKIPVLEMPLPAPPELIVLDAPTDAAPPETDAPIIRSFPAPKKTPVYQAQEPLSFPIAKSCTRRILEARAELTMQESAMAQMQAEMQRLQGNIREFALMTLEDADTVCEGEMRISDDATLLTMHRRPKLTN